MRRARPDLPVEVEAQSLAEVDQALEVGGHHVVVGHHEEGGADGVGDRPPADRHQHLLDLGDAKIKVADACKHVSQEAVQLHGAMGVTEELDIGSYFKRLLAFDTMFGGSAHHYRRHAALGGRASVHS